MMIHSGFFIYIILRSFILSYFDIRNATISYTLLGIIAGGVSACVTFVVQSSNNSSVRGVFTGEVVRSNTAWTGKHR